MENIIKTNLCESLEFLRAENIKLKKTISSRDKIGRVVYSIKKRINYRIFGQTV